MKLVALTSAALLAATSAFAGSYNTTVTPDVPVVVETPAGGGAPAGNTGSGSASWVIPAVAVVAIAGVLLACNDDDEDE